MQFIENALASLHATWYTMLFFTVLPMVLSVPRQLSLVYLIAYAIASACVIQFGIPERNGAAAGKNNSLLQSKMDEKTRIFFQTIKL